MLIFCIKISMIVLYINSELNFELILNIVNQICQKTRQIIEIIKK